MLSSFVVCVYVGLFAYFVVRSELKHWLTGAAVSLIQDEIEIEWNFDDIFSEQR